MNYFKQKQIAAAGSRPDFTFVLPRGRHLNMDVKFPLANYLKCLEASSELEKAQREKEFLKDVRARIKEVACRDYISAEQNTLDYVLLFIPNEHVYAMIHEKDPTLLEDALKNNVLLCSPLTLFAVLLVIRQAVDNFTLEQTSTEIMALMGAFKKQWSHFCDRMSVLGKRIGEAQKEYEALSTTRRRRLEKPLERIDALRAGHLETHTDSSRLPDDSRAGSRE